MLPKKDNQKKIDFIWVSKKSKRLEGEKLGRIFLVKQIAWAKATGIKDLIIPLLWLKYWLWEWWIMHWQRHPGPCMLSYESFKINLSLKSCQLCTFWTPLRAKCCLDVGKNCRFFLHVFFLHVSGRKWYMSTYNELRYSLGRKIMDVKYLENKWITKCIFFSGSSKKGNPLWLGVIQEFFNKSRAF